MSRVALITGMTGQDGLYLTENLHVDDLADACVFVTESCSSPGIINLGWARTSALPSWPN